jgi:Mg2+ and Co2+ transporter CorA
MVIGTFELFMTGTSQSTNDTMKVLTLVTLVVGLMGVIAGTMGMNFTTGFFESGTPGFVSTIAGMFLLTVAVMAVARWRRWL